MFRTVPLSIVRSFSLYTQQRYVSYRFADSLRAGSGRNVYLLVHILILFVYRLKWDQEDYKKQGFIHKRARLLVTNVSHKRIPEIAFPIKRGTRNLVIGRLSIFQAAPKIRGLILCMAKGFVLLPKRPGRPLDPPSLLFSANRDFLPWG